MTTRLLIILGFALMVVGCETPTSYSPEEAPMYVVIRDYAPFYRTGPMQSRGPDASLTTTTRVKLFRKEMGYSLVQLEDERTGYVANENLALAPPRPKPTPSESRRSGRSSRSRSSAAYSGEQVNDVPLPDPIPPPDLNIEPEDIPMIDPIPEPTPEKPKFRF